MSLPKKKNPESSVFAEFLWLAGRGCSARSLARWLARAPVPFFEIPPSHSLARLCQINTDTSVDLTLEMIKKRSLDYAKQIVEDRAEPQQIVATRPLYCLQHPLPIQVVCKRFFPAHIGIAIHEVDQTPFRAQPVPRQLWYTSIRDALFSLIS